MRRLWNKFMSQLDTIMYCVILIILCAGMFISGVQYSRNTESTIVFRTYRKPVTELLLTMELRSVHRENEELLSTISFYKERVDELSVTLQKYRVVELNDTEFDLVCRVVAAEARGETYEGQQGVAQVIRDRYLSGSYGNSVMAVVMSPYQFAEPWEGDLEEYPSIAKAVTEIFNGNNVFDGEALYFFNPTTSHPGAVEILRNGSAYFGVIGRHEFRGSANE